MDIKPATVDVALLWLWLPSATVPAVVPVLSVAEFPSPRLVRAVAAVVEPVPPLATATVPVTFVALPVRLAVMVPALKFPNPSRATTAPAVLPEVPKLSHEGAALPFERSTWPEVPAESMAVVPGAD